MRPTLAAMTDLPRIVLVRHGETEWTLTGQHTGRTDLPLTANGERQAIAAGKRLVGRTFARVLASPMRRTMRTCELCGFADQARPEPRLLEWNYGGYDGLTTREIQAKRPSWNVFRNGAAGVGGESPAEVSARLDSLVAELKSLDGDTLLFGHGHGFRALAARWLNLPIEAGGLLLLSTATLSELGFDHDRDEPAIRSWNVPS